METGWYAAIIRMRIKRRLHVRVGTNLTLKNSRQKSFVASTAVNSKRGEMQGGSAAHSPQKCYTTSKQSKKSFCSGLCACTFSITRQNKCGVHWWASVPVYACIYLCIHVFCPYLCSCILISAFMHVWMYGCTQRGTGQRGIEFGWGMGMGGAVWGWTGGGWGEQEQGGGWRSIMVNRGYDTGVRSNSVLSALHLFHEVQLQTPVRLEIRWHLHDK